MVRLQKTENAEAPVAKLGDSVSETERKRHRVATAVLCDPVALLPEVLIEDNSYAEIQTIASNMHGEMERKTRRCVACWRYALFSLQERLQRNTCSHYVYSMWLRPRVCVVPEAPSGKHARGCQRTA